MLKALRSDPDAMVLPDSKVPVMLLDPARLGGRVEPRKRGFWPRRMRRLSRPRQCRD